PHGWYRSDPRRLRDLGAVEEPHRYIATGVAPQPIMFAVAVEIALSDDRPHIRVRRADASGLNDLHAVQQPHRRVAVGVAPSDVALAVAVEVMGGGERRGGRRDAPDLVDGALNEPQCAVRPLGDAADTTVRRRNWEFSRNDAGGRNPSDLVRPSLGEP